MKDTSQQKMAVGREKLDQSFETARPTLQLGGIAATDPRFAREATKAGVRVLEPNHTAISCARAQLGLTSMREAYAHKHKLKFEFVIEVVRALRRVVPEHVFILSGAPGTFDEVEPLFDETKAHLLSEAGADGLFVEKDDYDEVERLTRIAHSAGLLVQASFQLGSAGTKTAVIPIDTPDKAHQTARRLADIGVDIVGMRFSGIFKSLGAGAIAPEELECLRGLADEVHGATVVYAGVNADNFPAVVKTGVKMVGIASAVDDLVYRTLVEAIGLFSP